MPARRRGHRHFLRVCVCQSGKQNTIIAGESIHPARRSPLNSQQCKFESIRIKSQQAHKCNKWVSERERVRWLVRLLSFSLMLWTVRAWVLVLLAAKLMSIVCRIVLCKCLLDLFDVACNHTQWCCWPDGTGCVCVCLSLYLSLLLAVCRFTSSFI